SEGDSSTASIEARAFLGYAPVLDAVAVLLTTETNYAALAADLTEAAASTPTGSSTYRSTALLRNVVERVLDREKNEKLVRNIRPALQAAASDHHWAQWEDIYSLSEQCVRLLGLLLHARPVLELAMPAELRSLYEGQLAAWLPEHPFLRDGNAAAN